MGYCPVICYIIAKTVRKESTLAERNFLHNKDGNRQDGGQLPAQLQR